MKKIVLACDLDNTLIHSFSHKVPGDILVELLRDKAQGYMSCGAFQGLRELGESIEIIPVTTRSVEQYRRIKLPVSCKRAITTNGGILLTDGQPDPDWQAASLAKARELMPLMEELKAGLEGAKDINVSRIVDDMYLYISAADRERAEDYLARYSDVKGLNVVISGRKVYFLPPCFTKGGALKRLLGSEKDLYLIAAGDSTIDLSMLDIADLSLMPADLAALSEAAHKSVFNGGGDFGEFVVRSVMQKAKTFR